MSQPKVAVICRFWNGEDLVGDWLAAIEPWAVNVFLLDAGSSDDTWRSLQEMTELHWLNFPGGLYRLPPSAPMLSGFYTNLLLRMLDDAQPELVVHLDQDEFLEPEIVDWFPRMVADPEHDAWSIVRRNFVFGRERYETTAKVMRFREHFCYRWAPGLRHPSPLPNGKPRQQGIHHLERIPLGHPAREDTEPDGANGYVPQLNARLGALPNAGPWMLHYNFRNEARNRLHYNRLRSQAHEDRPNLLATRETLNCPTEQYVPFAERLTAAQREELTLA